MLYPLNPLIYTANNMNTVYLREKYVFLKKKLVCVLWNCFSSYMYLFKYLTLEI